MLRPPDVPWKLAGKQLQVSRESENGVLIAEARGRLDGASAGDFERAVQEATGDCKRALLIDCENLSYVSSAGLRAMLLIARALARRNVPFALCSLPDRVAKVLDVSGFDWIISTQLSRAERSWLRAAFGETAKVQPHAHTAPFDMECMMDDMQSALSHARKNLNCPRRSLPVPRWAVCIGPVLALSACGGGGGGDSDPAPAEQIVDVSPQRLLPPVTTASCEDLYSRLADAAGDNLVALVRGAQFECIRGLERVSDPPLQIAVSREANALTVAGVIPELIRTYDASPGDGLRQAFRYLIVVKDIHHWCLTRASCEGGEWSSAESYPLGPGSPVYEAVKSGVDAFAAHPRFMGYEEQHAANLVEMVGVVIDYEMEAEFLHVVSRWL